MSATPRTDKAEATVPGFYTCATVPSRLARQLELENQELREALQAAVERMEAVAEGIPIANRARLVSPATHVLHMAGHLAQHAKIAHAALARSGKGEA